MDAGDDMDIDLGSMDEGEAIQLDPDQSTLTLTNNQNHAGDRNHSPGAASDSLTSHKIHIRGVDDLTTEDLVAFAAEHFPFETPTRIEWVDDTSANMVFDTPATAFKALDQFSNIVFGEHSPLAAVQLRPAKTFSNHPESSLQVRIALSTDRKRPRAYEASRFYMMHPELDPREQRRRDRSSQDGSNDYRRRWYGRGEHKRRKDGDSAQGFRPSMYDDDPSALASRENESRSKRGSYSMHSTLSSSDERSSGGDSRARRAHRGDTYRPGRHGRRGAMSRDRSASPGRVTNHTSDDSKRRTRRRTPPPSYQTRDPNPIPCQNQGRELFPFKSIPDTVTELFPQMNASANPTKELFPNKSITINHRRSDAFDAADETADLFASRLSVPFTERDNPTTTKRTTTAPSSSFGRLKGPDFEPDSEAMENLAVGGISIRGVSRKQDRGFSIRGAADDDVRNGWAKELFPGKALGNAGKELFAQKLQGRGGRRNKAEDMFY